MSDLEKRIQKLEDIEAIKCLMGKYYRCLDGKLWEELKSTFSPNCVSSYSGGKYSFKGPEQIVGFFQSCMGPDDQVSQHNGHTPEIHIESETKATAHWYLQDYLYIPKADCGLRGTAIYNITYEKLDGEWKILDIGYDRYFEERWARHDMNNIEFTDLGKQFNELDYYNKKK